MVLDRGYIDRLSMTLPAEGKVENALGLIREYATEKAAGG
jgi:hypothetical protein